MLRKLSYFLLITILALHVLAMIFGIVDPLHFDDSKSYWFTAGALVEKGCFLERFDTGTEPTTWRPPLTAILLYSMRALGFEPAQVIVIQKILTFLTSLLLYLTCIR